MPPKEPKKPKGAGTTGNYERGFVSPTEDQQKRYQRWLDRNWRQQSGPFSISATHRKQLLRRFKTGAIEHGCKTSLGTLSSQDQRFGALSGRQVGSWMCALKGLVRFKETKYSVQQNEFRLFIQGAEVTHYVEGSISWSMESTNGMNTCRFTLNNNEDAFIITPENICAGPKNLQGWRIPGAKKGKGIHPILLSPFRRNYRVDEVAKFIIYKNKYDMIDPEGEYPSIDPVTRMWVYPLAHYHCIFNKHDPVRLFIKLPHLGSEVTRGTVKTVQKYDLWTPVFTGFIKDYSWTDDPVGGHRKVTITCYDIRGLMERMRVQINAGTPIPDAAKGGDKKKQDPNKPLDKDPDKDIAKYLWERKAKVEAYKCKQKLLKKFGKTFMPASMKAINYSPWQLAKAMFLHAQFAMLQEKAWQYAVKAGAGKCSAPATLNPNSPEVTQNKGGFMDCARHAYEDTAKIIGQQFRAVIAGLCEAMEAIFDLRNLTGDEYEFRIAKDYKKLTSASSLRPSTPLAVKLFARLDEVPIFEWTVTSPSKKDQFAVHAVKQAWDNARGAMRIAYLAKAAEFAAANYRYRMQAAKMKKPASFEELGEAWYEGMANAYAGITGETPETKLSRLKKKSDTVEKELDQIYNKIVSPITNNKYLTEIVLLGVDSFRGATKLFLLYSPHRKITEQIKAGTYDAKIWDVVLSGGKTPESQKQLWTKALEEAKKAAAAALAAQGATVPSTSSIPASYRAVMDEISKVYLAQTTGLPDTIQFLLKDRLEKQTEIARKKVDFWLRATAHFINPGKPTLSIAGPPAIIDSKYINIGNLLVNGSPGVVKNLNITNLVCGQFGSTKIGAVDTGAVPVQWGMDYAQFLVAKSVANITQDTNVTQVGLERYKNIVKQVQEYRLLSKADKAAGKSPWRLTSTQTTAEIVSKQPRFLDRAYGAFRDIKDAQWRQPHPLMGKSFEQAVEFLVETGTQIVPTKHVEIGSYNDVSEITKFNTTVLFGVIGRPITFAEVTEVGLRTTSRQDSTFNPLNVFYHMLLPKNGTGARTILQKNTGRINPNMNATQITYDTRKNLMDQICESLDMQWYVSGWGDIVIEIPNYNAYPRDFGTNYKDAYTFKRDWISAVLSEEGKDIPTGWMFTGQEADKLYDKQTQKGIHKPIKQTTIMAPILARRMGAKVEHVNLRIPGIGAATQEGDGSDPQQTLDQLKVFAYFYVQRQVGKSHTLDVTHPFRPYIVPNRPIWLVHRQRVGLVQSVSHTLNPPDGKCTSDTTLHYVRWLNRDGTFRHMAGGDRQIIDYVKFFLGIPGGLPGELVGTEGSPKAATPRSRNPGLFNAAATAKMAARNPYKTAVGNAFGQAFAPVITDGSRKHSKDFFQPDRAGYVADDADTGKKDKAKFDLSKVGSYFYDDFAFGANRQLMNFGVVRRFNKKYIQETRRKAIKWHNGIDINAPVGTITKTPVDLDFCMALLDTVGNNRSVKYGKRVHKFVPVLTNPLYGQFFVPGSDGKPVLTIDLTPGLIGPAAYKVKIFMDAYKVYMRITYNGTKTGNLKVRHPGGSGGLYIHGFGYVKPPNVPSGATSGSGKLRVKMNWMHLDDLVKRGEKYIGVQTPAAYGKGRPVVKAGEAVGKIGGSFGYGPHLHFEMAIVNSSKNDPDLLKLAIAQNKDFLEKQLYARATGWQSNKPNTDPYSTVRSTKYAASYWQSLSPSAKRRYGLPQTGKLTAKQVAEALKRAPKFTKAGKSLIDLYSTAAGLSFRYTKQIKVNPAHYFKVEDLVDLGSIKGYHPLLKYFGSSPRTGGYRRGRDPSEKKWCSALATAIAGLAATKSRRAASKAARATAADPANAATQKEKAKKAAARQKKEKTDKIEKQASLGRQDPIKGEREADRQAKYAMRYDRRAGFDSIESRDDYGYLSPVVDGSQGSFA